MNAVFSREGSRIMRFAWMTLAIAVAAACALAWGGYWYQQKERRDGVASKRQLGDAQVRLANAKRERDDLRASSEVFEDLVSRGILKEESRLDLFDRLHALKVRHRLLGLEYEIAPQRPLPLAGGRAFNAVDVLGSRVKVKALALHEGDALAFLEELSMPPKGFNPVSHCTLRRLEATREDAAAPRVEAACILEWISLKDKRGARAN
jgi:hypothetical protein